MPPSTISTSASRQPATIAEGCPSKTHTTCPMYANPRRNPQNGIAFDMSDVKENNDNTRQDLELEIEQLYHDRMCIAPAYLSRLNDNEIKTYMDRVLEYPELIRKIMPGRERF